MNPSEPAHRPSPSIERASTGSAPRAVQAHDPFRGVDPVTATEVKPWAAMRLAELLRSAGNYAGLIAALVFLPSLLSAVLATWSASTSGVVTVYSIGKTGTSHAIVPWLQGWARFASPLVILASFAVCPSKPEDSKPRQAAFIVLAAAGVAMLCFSSWFTSLRGVLLLSAITGYVALAHVVEAVFGRAVVTIFLFATVAALVYVYAAA